MRGRYSPGIRIGGAGRKINERIVRDVPAVNHVPAPALSRALDLDGHGDKDDNH